MNDTAGPKGLAPSLLFFGVLPQLLGLKSAFPPGSELMKAIQTTRNEYDQILAQQRVRQALNKKPLSASMNLYTPGHPVYVYHERSRKWTGPHYVVQYDGKRVLIDLGERTRPLSFNTALVKPVKLPLIQDLLQSTDSLPTSGIPLKDPFGYVKFTEFISSRDTCSVMFYEAKKKEQQGLIEL